MNARTPTSAQAPFLQKGQTIGVFAPSSYVEENDIAQSADFARAQGYEVFVHPQTYARHHQSAGTEADKLAAYYDLLGNPEIAVIWAAGGGNRALHWIDSIDFDRVRAHPKILIGFSDVTALLNAIYAYTGIGAVHGATFNRLHRCPQREAHLRLLAGAPTDYRFQDCMVLEAGQARGRLVGGNLSIFQYLPATLPDFTEGAILFLEDCNEELSRIDRMLLHLKRCGVLGRINGLVLGQFGDMKDTGRPYGFTMAEVIRDLRGGRNIPIVLNAPFGHGADLWPFMIGQQVTLDASESAVTIAP